MVFIMILAFYLIIAFLAIISIIAIKTIIVKRAVNPLYSILNMAQLLSPPGNQCPALPPKRFWHPV
jgi:hypothetical protein